MARPRPRRKQGDGTGPQAVLDVGSNTVRLLVARPADASLKHIHEEGEFVRLGDEVDRTGVLRPDREKAALRAIERLTDRARGLGAERVVALATSAVRDAENAHRFIRRVRTRTGIELLVLSGHGEAELVYLGATLGLPLAEPTLIVDLGGGSAEIIGADAGGMRWARSLPLGCRRLKDRFIAHDPPTGRELGRLEEHVCDVLRDLPPIAPAQIVLTGGTANRVARVLGSDDALTSIHARALDRLFKRARKSPARELARRYRMRPERAEVFAVGVCILRVIAASYNTSKVVINRSGFREGALIHLHRGDGPQAS